MRGQAIGAFLEKLSEGDPIAVGFVVGFVVVGAVIGLFVLKVKRDLRLDDEKQARKYGRRPSK